MTGFAAARWYPHTPEKSPAGGSQRRLPDHRRCSKHPDYTVALSPFSRRPALAATTHPQPLAQTIALRHPGFRCDIDSHPDCRSLLTLIVAPQLQLVIAASPELISGYWSGKFDLVLQRFVDAIMTFPWLFLTLTIMSLLGPGVLQIIFVLGFQWGIANVRTIRAVVLSTRENVYVEAARAVGCPTPKILVRHILPHMWAPIIVLFTVSLGANIIGEATVSFLGFGIPPPQPSWGTTLSVEGKKYMLKNPWLSLWPGLSLAVVVYGVNMLGDALRDLLDSRLRGGIGRVGAAN